jgi:hypothetical protein
MVDGEEIPSKTVSGVVSLQKLHESWCRHKQDRFLFKQVKVFPLNGFQVLVICIHKLL